MLDATAVLPEFLLEKDENRWARCAAAKKDMDFAISVSARARPLRGLLSVRYSFLENCAANRHVNTGKATTLHAPFSPVPSHRRHFCFCYFDVPIPLPPVPTTCQLRLSAAFYHDDRVLKNLIQLVVHASTRAAALSGLRKALREFQVIGLPTNIDFCERVAGHRAFARGGVTTAFLEEHGDEVMPSPETLPPPPHAVVLASVAVLLHEVGMPQIFFFFLALLGVFSRDLSVNCRQTFWCKRAI